MTNSKRKVFRIIQSVIFLAAVVLVVTGGMKAVQSGRAYSFAAEKVLRAEGEGFAPITSEAKTEREKKNFYFLLGGADEIVELEGEREAAVTLRRQFGKARLIAADETGNILLDTEKEGTQTLHLPEGRTRVVVVGKLFCGSAEVRY